MNTREIDLVDIKLTSLLRIRLNLTTFLRIRLMGSFLSMVDAPREWSNFLLSVTIMGKVALTF